MKFKVVQSLTVPQQTRKEKQLNNKYRLLTNYMKKKKTLPGPPRAANLPNLPPTEGTRRHKP
jgi:hypothetical protein